MLKLPSLSSRELARMLEKSGVSFVRQGSTDHAVFARIVDGRRYSAPVQMGKKTLDPNYCKRVFRLRPLNNSILASLPSFRRKPENEV